MEQDQNIIELLQESNRAYYDDGESDLDDEQYDALLEHAQRQGVKISTLTPPPDGSPWPTIAHKSPMLGIDYVAKNKQEWMAIVDNDPLLEGHLSLKYDGLALELQYDDDGNLCHCVLRGDGFEGEDVFNNARLVRGIAWKVKTPNLNVYGEVCCSFNNLNAINELREIDGDRTYKTTRSVTAMVRNTKACQHQLVLLTFRPYRTYPSLKPTQDDELKALHFESVGPRKFDPIEAHRASAVTAWKARIGANDSRDKWQYPLDGVVFQFANGELAKLKFPAMSAVTTVTGIAEQLGRTGIVAPVLEFETVRLLGTEVKRASIFNAELAASRLPGLGIGAKVIVSKRGDVIPHVEKIVSPADVPWVPPTSCPSCGSPLEEDGAYLRCSADAADCPGTTVGLLRKFCMELGIDGFGPGVCWALVNAGYTLPHHLYMMDSALIEDIPTPSGSRLGSAAANRLIARVHRRSELTWGELLGSIGVQGCAKSVMEAVAERFPPDELQGATVHDLMEVDGVGPERAAQISTFLDERWFEVIAPLLEVVSLRRTDGPLNGKTFCITLGLKTGSRTAVEGMIRAAGGGVKSSVSRKVTHVVCNSPDENTSKLKKAREYGIPIISERRLLDMIGEGTSDLDAEPNPNDNF